MDSSSKARVSKYSLMSYVYFFFNCAGLPGGLMYTNIITPVLYLWIIYKKKQPVLYQFFLVLIPYDIIHLLLGVKWKSFIVSNLLFLSTYIFVVCCMYFLNHYHRTGRIFKNILLLNFLFTLVAVVVYFTPFRELLWYKNKFTHSVEDFYRLSLLTFEASYYSLLFAPVSMYFLLKLFVRQHTANQLPIVVMCILPLCLSLSLGVIGAMLFAFTMMIMVNWEKVFYKRSFLAVVVVGVTVLVFLTLVLFVFFPDNPVYIRLHNIYYGIDTSTRGRTTESFGLAWKVAAERSIWFGSGLGQIKELAYDIVKRYYDYWGDLETVRIPNAVGETLAIFGIAGLILRFGCIVYLFFKTKVLTNYYRTCIFFFVFIYQFTGSYITNIVEYVLWCIAFSSAFEAFNRRGAWR
jgi:hypothetical protein